MRLLADRMKGTGTRWSEAALWGWIPGTFPLREAPRNLGTPWKVQTPQQTLALSFHGWLTEPWNKKRHDQDHPSQSTTASSILGPPCPCRHVQPHVPKDPGGPPRR